MLATDLLQGCREKLSRAEMRLGELNDAIQTFLKSKPYAVEADPDPQTGDVRIRVYKLREVPSVEWGAAVGEIVHNLRSTLDQLTWALTVHHQGRGPLEALPRRCWWRNVSFPIFLSPSGWKNRREDLLKGVDPALWVKFKREQPFSPGKATPPDRDDLWILEELWNRDKHRSVPLVVAHLAVGYAGIGKSPEGRLLDGIMGQTTVSEEFKGLHARIVQRTYGPIQDGKIIGRLRFTSGKPPTHLTRLQRYLNEYARASFDIAFEKGPPAYGYPVRRTVRIIKGRVADIVDKFAGDITDRRIARARSHCPPPR